MQSDELELVICRFCGISPKLNLEYSVDNCKCLHSLEIFGLSRNIIYDAQETNLKKIVMLFKELWNARNEKHNPFREVKNAGIIPEADKKRLIEFLEGK